MNQYQNLEPNRGIYKNMRFPVAPFAEYPKWIDVVDGEGKTQRVLVQTAAEERSAVLASATKESADAPVGIVLERNKLAEKVSELSQALAEAKAAPELLQQEMAKMREQMAEMAKQLMAVKTAPAKPKAEAPAS